MALGSRVKTGFTLMEMVLSVGIMGLILSLGAPIFFSFLNRNEAEVAKNVLVSDLYRAQSQSRNNQAGDSWGVKIQTGTITLFEGSSYATRVTSQDKTYRMSSRVNVAGTSEYLFTKFTGMPTAIGNTTLSYTSTSRTVTINTKGMVDY